ncbi:MAG: DUF1847 domain-containing protein [Clostridia bacterium]
MTNCANCLFDRRLCRIPGADHMEDCATLCHASEARAALEVYCQAETHEFAAQAARQERSCYGDVPGRPGVHQPLKPRIVEVMEFCERMGYKKLGLAFCGGLHREANAVAEMFSARGFEVCSVMCKFGGVDKSRLGLTDDEKICGGGHESMCNPIGQALVLNQEKTEFNILLGLCVGHDSLFLKHADALCTVLAVKDRLLGHNPLAAVYTSPSYYKYLR